MNETKIIVDNIEKNVDGILYLYNNKYYFIYTEKELDENGYVILHLVQVGKEIQNTPTGPVDTGYMIGMEVSDDEWKIVQESITKIVNDKKNNMQNSSVQYLPINMLSTLKIINKRTFRLLKDIMINDFGVQFNENNAENLIESKEPIAPIQNVIIDYRTKYFEEHDKVQELENTINDLKQKIEDIKKIIG